MSTELVKAEESLALVHGAAMTRVGLRLPDGLSYDKWAEVGRRLKLIEGAVMWAIGDWLNYGEKRYGETYAQAMNESGYEYGTCANAKYVSSRFEFSLRNENLSWTHHYSVASEEPEVAAKWLELAEKYQWSVQELRKQRNILAEKLSIEAKGATYPALYRHCDATTLLHSLAPQSVDLLLTDPPYSTDIADFDAFLDEWLLLALNTVKPTGRAFICCGAYSQELAAYLTRLLPTGRRTEVLVWHYRNTLGPQPSEHFIHTWQAILHIWTPTSRALASPRMTDQFDVLDISAPDGRQFNRYHTWQKPMELGKRLIRLASTPGDLVIDPFCCTGTFGLAASALGRRSLSGDTDAEALAIFANRGGTEDDKNL